MPGGRSQEADFRGDLQAEVMAAVWRLREATVEDVRALQPAARRSAYTTIQTVLNRLAERGLLSRAKEGRRFVYRARADQIDYLTRTISQRLGKASPDARRSVLMNVVDALDGDDLDELARYANRIRRKRREGGDDG
ncbi:MAG: BlaI/MecI/CopY family transcriptional regulator [Thermoleophilaceae bacterium]